MPGQQTTSRRGRPTLLDQVVRYRELPDGQRVAVTAGEQVIERRRLGLDEASAAASAGISKSTLWHWRLDGARWRAEEARGATLGPKEAQLRDFVDALERAEAEWEAGNLGIIARAAQGGAVVTKTTEKWTPGPPNPDGSPSAPRLVERTVVTETLAPQWTAAAWQLERMRQDKYRKRMELTGAEGKPLVPEADQARGLADALRAFQAEPKPARPARPRAPRPRKTPTKGHPK